jgi:GNAT superfamily N-acetyltransferase
LDADPDIIRDWVEGWSLSRGVKAPVSDHGAWRVEVGAPDQLRRYVFAGVHSEIADLAQTISTPFVFIKAATSAAKIAHMFPSHWEVTQRGAMMVRTAADPVLPSPQIPAGYVCTIEADGAALLCRITTLTGEQAAQGRIVFVGDSAIFDRIITEETHARRGLGTAVMLTLHGIARDHAKTTNILSATEQGIALYGTIGWRIHSPYTSAVIAP